MHVLLKLAVYLLLAYALLVVLVFLMQRKLLYFPAPGPAVSHTGLSMWPDQASFQGWLSSPVNPDIKGTVIVFHGNAGAASDRYYFAEALNPLGYRVILAEYPGYSGRPGSPSEQSIVADAGDIAAKAHTAFGDPLFLMGESLGCGVAAAVVADTDIPIAGLALITPWNSLPNLAQHHYPYVPVRWLMRDRYDSVSNLADYTGKVAVAVAERDMIIPTPFSMNLYDSLSTDKELWSFPNAGHNSWPTDRHSAWWAEMMGFLYN